MPYDYNYPFRGLFHRTGERKVLEPYYVFSNRVSIIKQEKIEYIILLGIILIDFLRISSLETEYRLLHYFHAECDVLCVVLNEGKGEFQLSVLPVISNLSIYSHWQ